MQATLKGIKIGGICATIPAAVYRFEDELKAFPFSEKSSRRLARIMGFKEHRISDPATSPCDMVSYTLNHLFNTGRLNKNNVQALVVVAQMADHPIPGNSKVIHGQLDLPITTFCTDIYENCTGFISGLFTAGSYVAAGACDEVILAVTDAAACYANKMDRNSYPLCGDGAAITVISKSSNPEDKICFVFRNDGSQREAIYVPAGGCRLPSSPETAKMRKDEMGNYRSLNNMHMDGTAVFQFVMDNVPALIEEACAYAGLEKKDIQYHLTHQPNRFMLEKLADLMHVPREILFNNIVENFGNSSSATIPVNIAYNLGKKLLNDKYLVCLSAFGAGLSLATAILRLGDMNFCELIEHPGNGAINQE